VPPPDAGTKLCIKNEFNNGNPLAADIRYLSICHETVFFREVEKSVTFNNKYKNEKKI
jgi:hypothetical protein